MLDTKHKSSDYRGMNKMPTIDAGNAKPFAEFVYAAWPLALHI